MTNLGIIRLSEIKGDAQTGPVRQREMITAKFAQLGVDADEITWAQDLDVSAFHVPPLKRPSLRRALDGLSPDSTIVFYRLDRLVRRVFPDWSDMVSYAAERKLSLISATEPLDLSGAMGLMAATTLAFVGQMESENTSARVKNTQQHFRQIGRWRGSVPPYGYRPARVDGKPGWWLEIDPESAIVAREAADRVLAGESVNALASDFNDRALPAPFDRARDLQGKPRLCACGHDAHDEPCSKLHKCRHRVKVTGHKQVKAHELDECSQPCPEYRPKRWARESIMQILRSPALLGHTVEDGRVLLGDDGMPIAFAPGVIDQETWTRLQERLDARSYQKVRTATDSMLLGIARCDCGSFLYRSDRVKANGREYKYYRERFDASCGARLIPAPVLDKLVTQALLDIVGGYEVLRRETEAGSGHEVELRAVGAQIVELTQDMFVRGRPRDDYADMMARLQARHAELSAALPLPSATKMVATGQTFRQSWESMSLKERRLWLLDAGVSVIARRGATPSWTLPVGPLEAEEVPRFVLADDGDVHAVVLLGGLAGLLRRIHA